mgnify:CR=1 FL=1
MKSDKESVQVTERVLLLIKNYQKGREIFKQK